MLVAEQLHLEVPRSSDVFFEKHVGAAERRERLPLGLLEIRGKLRFVEHDPHAASSAAVGRLEHDRIAKLRGKTASIGQARHCVGTAGQNRHTGFVGDFAGGRLVAKPLEQLRPRADEDQPGLVAGAPQRGVLREKSIAGMDGVNAVRLRDSDNPVDIQIGANRLPFAADAIGLIGLEAVQGVAVFLRINGDGANAQLMGGAKHADRNLAAIGDQKLPNCLHASANGRQSPPGPLPACVPDMVH